MRQRAALLGLLLLVCPRVADACINAEILEKDEIVKMLARAERAIQEGKYRHAVAALDLEGAVIYAEPGLERRHTLLLAVARMRLGKSQRAEAIFRRMLEKDPENPYLKTRLAEALSWRTGFEAIEAFDLLDDLEERDLIPDAEGYAALARLRHRASDEVGRDRAVERCQKMARNAGKICPTFTTVASR